MKLRHRFSLLCMAVLLATTAAFPREVSTDFDHHADFSRFKTYSDSSRSIASFTRSSHRLLGVATLDQE